jgi:hypothetical protein
MYKNMEKEIKEEEREIVGRGFGSRSSPVHLRATAIEEAVYEKLSSDEFALMGHKHKKTQPFAIMGQSQGKDKEYTILGNKVKSGKL